MVARMLAGSQHGRAKYQATLWLAQCTQADLLSKFTSVYSLAHGMAFPYSFLLMMLMSAWHIGKQSQRESRTGAFISTALMWLSMYPVCLISEPIALRRPVPLVYKSTRF